MVMNEALRYESPAPMATPVYLKQDMQLGKYQFLKGDVIVNSFYGLHFNGDEWQRPFEFLPECFDSQSELSLTPDGKKRNAASFAPFNGGSRVCMGKTFAEANLKIMMTYLTQSFDFEHMNPDFQSGQFPYAHFLQGSVEPRMVKLTLNTHF